MKVAQYSARRTRALKQGPHGPRSAARRPANRWKSRVLAVLAGAVGTVAVADHEGLPFTEPFDTAHLADTALTTADWGVASPGLLTMPLREPVVNPFDGLAAGEVVGTLENTTRALALGDLNGDGLLDLVEGNNGLNYVYLNAGGSFPAGVALPGMGGNTRGLVIADMNLDGHLDIVAVNLNTPPMLYLNSGDGVQYTVTNISPNIVEADALAVADLNGDGFPDVAVAVQNWASDLIYFHTGDLAAPFGPDGVVGREIIPGNPAENAQVVRAGDIDNDGDMDLLVINGTRPDSGNPQPNRVYLNDGAGNFTSVQVGPATNDSQAGALADLNGDGFLDVIVGNYPPGEINQVFLNSGDPTAPFSEGSVPIEFTMPGDPNYTHHVIAADVDNDGDLDVIVAAAGIGLPIANDTRFTNRVYLNDGTGTLTPGMDLGADMEVTNVVVAGDVDGNGLIDIIAGNEDRDADNTAFGAPTRLYRNIGTPSGAAPVQQLHATAVSVRVDTETAPIAAVTLDAALETGLHGKADFWVSANGGVNWLYAHPGRELVIPADMQGTDLRWKAHLESLSPAAAGAAALAVDSVTLGSVGTPQFTSAPVLEALVDTPYSYTVTTSDPEGEIPVLSAPALPAWLQLTDNGDGTGTLAGTPTAEHVGDHAVELIATDPGGVSGTQAFTVTVAAAANEVPAFTSEPLTTATVDAEYAYTVTATDANGDALAITAVGPDWLTLTDNGDGTATLVGTPTIDHLGDHAVELTVTDAQGAVATQPFTVTVSEVPNDAPLFGSEPVTAAVVDTEYAYAITTTDANGDLVAITGVAVPAWLALTDNGDGTASLVGTPAAEHVGGHAVELLATDANGATATQAFTVTVTDEAVENQAPAFSSAPVTAATEDAAYSYAVTTEDPDAGDTRTIIATALPAWLTFVDNGDGTATLNGTPGEAEVGDHTVVLTVTDAAGATAEQSFTINVAAATNGPPTNPPQQPQPPSSGGGGGSWGLIELLAFGALGGIAVRRSRRSGGRSSCDPSLTGC